MDIGKVFGERLLKLREERNETQDQLAKAVGITRQSLSRYETNERTPNIELIYNIAKHYEVSADYLLGLSEVKSLDNRVQAACEVTGLSEKAIEKLNNCYNDEFSSVFTKTISDIISCDSFFEMIEELWHYGENSLQTEYIEDISGIIQEISNNREYSIELRENFMTRFANCFNLSADKIYCDSSYRKECNKTYEQFGFAENFSIAYCNVTFLRESKDSLDLSDYNTVKRFQQLMNLYQEKTKKGYSLFKTNTNNIVKNFYHIGFDKDRPLTNEEQKFKEYISELFKEVENNGEHNPETE